MNFKYIITTDCYFNEDFVITKNFLCKNLEEVETQIKELKKWCSDYRELKFVRVFSLDDSIKNMI